MKSQWWVRRFSSSGLFRLYRKHLLRNIVKRLLSYQSYRLSLLRIISPIQETRVTKNSKEIALVSTLSIHYTAYSFSGVFRLYRKHVLRKIVKRLLSYQPYLYTIQPTASLEYFAYTGNTCYEK